MAATMYKAVIFDFGNVLCEVDRMSFACRAAPFSRLSPEAFDAAIWNGRLEVAHETGALDSMGYYKAIAAETGLSPDYSYERFVEDYKSIIKPNPDGEAGLVEAKNLGARTFILSNTSWLHGCTIFGNEVLATIPELHILSFKVGIMKPDPRVWRILLGYARLEARECIYVDDAPKNCEASEKLGFATILYDKNAHNLAQIVRNMLK
jgi:FMN phosphatase YigB (HAD superfamily)